LALTVDTIKEDMETARKQMANREMLSIIEQANELVESANSDFELGNFDSAREEYESARELYTRGADIARDFSFEDESKIRQAILDMKSSIDACLISKAEALVETASKEKGQGKVDAFSKVAEFLGSFSSSNPRCDNAKAATFRGLAAGKIEIGLELMGDAEALLNKGDYYKANEGYRTAEDYFQALCDFAVEYRLEAEKNQVDNLIEYCGKNARACTNALLNRERVTKDNIIKVEDLKKGIVIPLEKEPVYNDRLKRLQQEYKGIRFIDSGGFGDVYLVENRKGVTLAIKILRELSEDNEQIFFGELETWAKLKHINIVQFIRPRLQPVPLFEMEYIDGGDLKALLQNNKPLSIERACRIAFGISRGLKYAHSSHNVVHSDIKPRNILLTKLEEPKITDWGLGKIATSSLGIRGYTPGYAAPEQVERQTTDRKTDIYQLGLVLYEMLAGDNPFAHGTSDEMDEMTLSLIPEAPSIYTKNPILEPFDDIVLHCLEKEPQDRPSFQEFQEVLYRYMKERHGESLPITINLKSKMVLLCWNALMEAETKRHSELLSTLDRLKSEMADKQRRQYVQNLMKKIAFCKLNDMEIGSEIIDEINVLLRFIECEDS